MKVVWKGVRCTKRFALIVVRNAKFPSNPTAQDQCIAENVTQSEDPLGKIGHTGETKQ